MMTRKEMIAFVRGLIAQYKNDICAAEKAGILEKREYTWQEYLADNTGVAIADLTDLARLSDAELRQIVEVYI